MQILKNGATSLEYVPRFAEENLAKRYRYALSKFFELERFQDLVDTHKSMVSNIYEKLGAGTTFTVSKEDHPDRKYFLT